MAKVKETPLFITESEMTVFSQKHPKFNYYKRVYYKDNTVAGYLAYQDEPQD